MKKINTIISIILALLIVSPAHALEDTDRQGIIFKNLLDPWNGGFENGHAVWTIDTDTWAVATSGSNLLIGKGSATWNSAGASRNFKSKAVTIPNGLYGQNGLAQCRIMTPSGTATHTISVYDGTSTLSTVSITSSTLPILQPVNFVFPSSGTIQLRITSVAADEPSITIDDCYVGAASNLTNVSQAEFFGSQKIAGVGSCYFTGTNSASFNNFAADGDCGTPTTAGYANSTAGKTPAISFASLPPGRYLVTANITADLSTVLSCGYRLSDGTNTVGASYGAGTGAAGNSATPRQVLGTFNYTAAQGATTIQVQSATVSGSGTCDIGVTLYDFEIQVYRFPAASELAFRPDVGPSSWSGYHSTGCSWARTNTSYGDPTADATCTLTEAVNRNFGTVVTHSSAGNALPGITFTPTRSGNFWVCANVFASQSSTGQGSLNMSDGTTTISERSFDIVSGVRMPYMICGIYNATSVSAKTIRFQFKSSTGNVTVDTDTTVPPIEWNIFAMDFLNTPIIITNYSWAGYHDTTCSWAVTQAAFTADFATDATCALSERDNSNFGTVTTMAGALPGIIFTPPVVGRYNVCAYVEWAGATLAATLTFKLWDGTTTVAERTVQTPATNHGGTVPICGIYNATSSSAKTISIRGKASTGAINITNLGSTSTIEWSIFKL